MLGTAGEGLGPTEGALSCFPGLDIQKLSHGLWGPWRVRSTGGTGQTLVLWKDHLAAVGCRDCIRGRGETVVQVKEVSV